MNSDSANEPSAARCEVKIGVLIKNSLLYDVEDQREREKTCSSVAGINNFRRKMKNSDRKSLLTTGAFLLLVFSPIRGDLAQEGGAGGAGSTSSDFGLSRIFPPFFIMLILKGGEGGAFGRPRTGLAGPTGCPLGDRDDRRDRGRAGTREAGGGGEPDQPGRLPAAKMGWTREKLISLTRILIRFPTF